MSAFACVVTIENCEPRRTPPISMTGSSGTRNTYCCLIFLPVRALTAISLPCDS